MRIIGIDPGIETTGFCILDKTNNKLKLAEYGCIKTSKSTKESQRLDQIANDITSIIKKWKPEKASLEKIFFSKNVKTAISVAQAKGVIMQHLEKNGIIQKEFTPNQIKSAICGYGNADKKMVQTMIKNILNLRTIPQPDDAADAIAAAVCFANTMQIK